MIFERSGMGAGYLTLRAPHAKAEVGDTWYWEEGLGGGTQRFYEQIGAAAPSGLITVQPGGYEEASEYQACFANGREALFTPEVQEAPNNRRFGADSLSTYFPNGLPAGIDPRKVPLLQFHLGMPYGSYNWEVFYHLPITVARFMASQQRFEEAQRWIAHVFNPTTNDPATGRERYWRCLPLRHDNASLTIEQLMTALARPDADPAIKHAVQDQVAGWASSPFSPFAVARARNSAYEWYAVVAYVTNLIEWGDSLFRRDTRESINEATLLYVLASNILGRRPQTVPPRGSRMIPLTFRALAGRWDEFSNAWARLIDTPMGQALLEWLLAWQKSGGINPHAFDKQIEQLTSIGALYFCIPHNDRLLDLWARVEDRLFKIRHCQNIDGVTRQLALLDSPIDPELLIRARLAGVDIDDVLGDRFTAAPHHRFEVLWQRASELCRDLRAMASELLSAIEKKDAERLAQLRSTHEIDMLGRVETVRMDQVREAQANVLALEQSRRNTTERYLYLQRLLGNTDIRFDAAGVPVQDQRGSLQVRDAGAPGDFRGLGLIPSEVDQTQRMQDTHTAAGNAAALKLAASAYRTTASFLSAYPATMPAGTSLNLYGQALADLGDLLGILALDADHRSRWSGLVATFQRRRDDWIHQSSAAVDEIRLINRQIAAAEIRKTMAETELANHRRSREHVRDIEDYLRQRKFSTADLYTWMEGQLNVAHYEAYQLAFDLAKRVERAYRRELGENDSARINYGYWSGGRKGLQAGEQLQIDLNRLQAAYLERSRREFELTKHVSLLALDPTALVKLRQTGTCKASIPEALYDIDFPGHYFRRIKSASVTIPCVTGPYGGVHATLMLLKSSVRISTQTTPSYARDDSAGPDTRFEDSFGPAESIVTSSGQNDSGLFELSLRDDRFLPFEGAGAISTWSVELPYDFRPFDYSTIADVIVHVRYTARYGSDDLKMSVRNALNAAVNAIARSSGERGLVRLLSLKQEFPTEWLRLTAAAPATGNRVLTFALSKRRFPYLFTNPGVTNTITNVDLLVVPRPSEQEEPEFPSGLTLMQPDGEELANWTANTSISGLPGRSAMADVVVESSDDDALWTLTLAEADVQVFRERIEDVLMSCSYTIA